MALVGAGRSMMMTLILLILLISSSPMVMIKANNNNIDSFESSRCLKVPTSEFVGVLKSTMDTVSKVASLVAKFSKVLGDFRLSNAIYDCLDLLDLSAEELSWTLSSATHDSQNGKNNSSGDLSLDLRTWLSAVLVNQDTCIESFDGILHTKSFVRSVVAGSLNKVSSLVQNALVMVRPTPPTPKQGDEKGRGGGHPATPRGRRKLMKMITSSTSSNSIHHFPNWLRPKDRKLLLQGTTTPADVVVATDGSGNFKSITEAVSAAPEFSTKRFVIYVKKGVYNEYVEISKKKWNVMMIGDGKDVTVVTGNRNFIDGWTTYRSATFAVKGRGFIARDMTFQNTAGPEKHQAVAFRSDSDLSVLYRCGIRGYQDTLYAHSMRQFYRECEITGTVDFIFGDGSVVFQKCQILARKGLANQKNTITAQGRKDPTEPTGFSIQFSNISGETDLLSSAETYLGRPWKQYSRTVIMQSFISSVVRPQGWLEWNGNFALDTLFYGEYMNFGAGAGLGSRVKWPGYHVINDTAEANKFTVAQFILGNEWLPSTGVKYTAGLVE